MACKNRGIRGFLVPSGVLIIMDLCNRPTFHGGYMSSGSRVSMPKRYIGVRNTSPRASRRRIVRCWRPLGLSSNRAWETAPGGWHIHRPIRYGAPWTHPLLCPPAAPECLPRVDDAVAPVAIFQQFFPCEVPPLLATARASRPPKRARGTQNIRISSAVFFLRPGSPSRARRSV